MILSSSCTEDHTAFLHRIIENPADNGLRLGYADYLEEHTDQQDRAEFIRVQCELAGAPTYERINSDGEGDLIHSPNLRCRERELLSLVGRTFEWMGDWQRAMVSGTPSIAVGDNGRCVIFHNQISDAKLAVCFRRGFVAEVTCRLVDWYGGQCSLCQGTGRVLERRASHMSAEALESGATWEMTSYLCESCGGSKTRGHSPAIVRATPLEVVRISDREPFRVNDAEYAWYGGTDRVGFHPQSDLPMEVFDLLPGPVIISVPTSHRRFASEAEAVAALSDALILGAKR